MSTRNGPLPPRRPWFVTRLPESDRGTALLVSELERMTEIASDRKVGPQIRPFLDAFRRATGHGNQAEIGLRIAPPRSPGASEALIYACVTTDDGQALRVRWLPMILVPLSQRIKRIMQECGWAPRFPEEKPKPVRSYKTDEDESGRRPFFGAKPELRLIRP